MAKKFLHVFFIRSSFSPQKRKGRSDITSRLMRTVSILKEVVAMPLHHAGTQILKTKRLVLRLFL